MSSTSEINRLQFDCELQLQLDINTLQHLNILLRKQSKYCRKLTRLNNITIRKQELVYFCAM